MIDTGIAWTLALAAVAFSAWLVVRQSREPLPSGTPSAVERERAANRLWESYPAFPDDEPDTALFLLEESRRAYDSWIDTNVRIEAKASSFVGFIAGGASLLSILSAGQADDAKLATGPFLFLAIAAAFVSLVCCVYVLRPKLRVFPNIAEYVSGPVALQAKARFHIALSLAEEYNKATIQIARLRRFDPVGWTCAQIFLGLAALAILINFGIQAEAHPVRVVHVLHCSGSVGPQRSTVSMNIVCRE